MRATTQRHRCLTLTLVLVGAVLCLGASFARQPIEDIKDIVGTWKGAYTDGSKDRVILIITEDGSYGGRAGKAPLKGTLRILSGNLEYQETGSQRIRFSLYERGEERLLRGFDEAGEFKLPLKLVKRRAKPGTLPLEDTRFITIGLRGEPLTQPPRTIDDIRELVGTPPRVPDTCAQIQAKRREALDVAFERIGEGPNPDANLSRVSPFIVATEWELARGNFKRTINLINQAIQRLRGQWLAWGRASLYVLLVRIEAAVGDIEAAGADFARAQKQWRKAVRLARGSGVGMWNDPWREQGRGYWVSGGRRTYLLEKQYEWSTAISEAALAQARGELPFAEDRYRQALAGKRYAAGTGGGSSFPMMVVYSDPDQLSAQLSANLLQQGRFAEAERHARDAVKEAFTYRPDSLKFTARTAQLFIQLSAVYLELDRLDDAEYLARLAISMHAVDCAAPDSLTFVRARQVLARVLAAKGDWQGVLEQVDQARSALAQDPAAFERFFGTNVEWALALVHTGEAAEGLRRLQAALAQTVKRSGVDSYEAAEVRGLLATGRVAVGDKTGALRGFSQALAALVARRDELTGMGDQTTRSARANAIIDSYMKLLTDVHGTPIAARLEIDTAVELLRAASIRYTGTVQSALMASAARAAAHDPKLTNLVRRDQDIARQITTSLDMLAYLDLAPPEQVDASVVSGLRQRIAPMRAQRVELAKRIRKRFPEYAELMNPAPPEIAAIQATLRPGEALVIFHAVADRTYVWAIRKSGRMVSSVMNLGRGQLQAKIDDLRQALEPQAETLGDIPTFDVAVAYELYAALLKPVEKGWKDAKHLLVVAHGPLGQLPLSVLPTAPVRIGEKHTPLFARYRAVPWLARTHTVTVLPSVSSLVTLRRLPQAEATRRPFAGFGDPYFSQAQQAKAETVQLAQLTSANLTVRGLPLTRRSIPQTRSVSSADLAKLPRLPDTAEEVQSIARALKADPSRDVFIGADASEPRVKTMDLSDRRVIVFATHGLVPGDLDGLTQPALALSSPKVTGSTDDGLLTMGEILGLKLNADWVVLSACNTAAAEGKGAEAVSGLGRAFFYAGARALLVSNWPVETTSAKALTTDLFRRQAQNPTLTRAEALQQAMLQLIDGPGRTDAHGKTLFSYAHPIFWAPFSLVGDGGGATARRQQTN
jgi:CHAT domain-containing protein